MPYDQAPEQCHPAPSRARRRGNGCGNGSAPPSGRLRLGVSSPSTSTFAPRLSAADRPSSPSWTHLRPSRPSSGPGRPWSSLVFVWSSEFGLRRDKFCGFGGGVRAALACEQPRRGCSQGLRDDAERHCWPPTPGTLCTTRRRSAEVWFRRPRCKSEHGDAGASAQLSDVPFSIMCMSTPAIMVSPRS